MTPNDQDGPAPPVSLVIPGRDAEATLGPCLSAACAILEDPDSRLGEVVFVDDGSRDATAEIASEFPVRLLSTGGRGAGAARNAGIRAASSPLVWFVDSDCVAEPDALRRLLPHMTDHGVGGVSGSYGIMNPGSLLASIIHEEIAARHARMAAMGEVDFLATFNVLYRKSVLDELGGFDERFRKGQDAELSFRVARAGFRLRFEVDSRVRHFHEERLLRYLRVQRQQGHWRVFLHVEHPGHARGDSYSSAIDHAQPPVALAALALTPLLAVAPAPGVAWSVALAPAGAWLVVLLMSAPRAASLVRRTGRWSMLAFAPMAAVRAVARGVGVLTGLCARARAPRKSAAATPPPNAA